MPGQVGRENVMTDYSKLSYQELCQMANNDAIADSLSEEEYEKLSRELWKKFRVEKRITAMDPRLAKTEFGLRRVNDGMVTAPLGKHATATK
jgi:hypothetical protein